MTPGAHPRLAAALLAACLAVAGGPAAAWEYEEVRDRSEEIIDEGMPDGRPLREVRVRVVAAVAEGAAESGDAQLRFTCSAEGDYFATISYGGFTTGSNELRVRYQLDGRPDITALWPVDHTKPGIEVFNLDRRFVDALAAGVIEHSRLLVFVETLPVLTFDLAGSRVPVSRVRTACR